MRPMTASRSAAPGRRDPVWVAADRDAAPPGSWARIGAPGSRGAGDRGRPDRRSRGRTRSCNAVVAAGMEGDHRLRGEPASGGEVGEVGAVRAAVMDRHPPAAQRSPSPPSGRPVRGDQRREIGRGSSPDRRGRGASGRSARSPGAPGPGTAERRVEGDDLRVDRGVDRAPELHRERPVAAIESGSRLRHTSTSPSAAGRSPWRAVVAQAVRHGDGAGLSPWTQTVSIRVGRRPDRQMNPRPLASAPRAPTRIGRAAPRLGLCATPGAVIRVCPVGVDLPAIGSPSFSRLSGLQAGMTTKIRSRSRVRIARATARARSASSLAMLPIAPWVFTWRTGQPASCARARRAPTW